MLLEHITLGVEQGLLMSDALDRRGPLGFLM